MKHTLEVKRTAHYYHDKAIEPSKGALIVLHGYAQLASEFIKEFKDLSPMGYHVYAPEALSKFYNKHQQPAANWMTSHERDDEIKDYINYLNLLVTVIKEKHKNIPLHFVGFSQGVSTLLRWQANSNINITSTHLVAGSIPEELVSKDNLYLNSKAIYFYYGNNDRLVRPANAEKYFNQLRAIDSNCTYVPFVGRHEIPKEITMFFATL